MAKRNDTQSAQIEENVKSAFYHQFIDQRVNRLTDPIVPTAANSELVEAVGRVFELASQITKTEGLDDWGLDFVLRGIADTMYRYRQAQEKAFKSTKARIAAAEKDAETDSPWLEMETLSPIVEQLAGRQVAQLDHAEVATAIAEAVAGYMKSTTGTQYEPLAYMKQSKVNQTEDAMKQRLEAMRD